MKEFDGKLVRITDTEDVSYEGVCDYHGREYCQHEFGINKECLEISPMLFFEEDIAEIACIDCYSEPFGEIEEWILNVDGGDGILDVYESEEPERMTRLLDCLASHLEAEDCDIPEPELKHVLKTVAGSDDPAVRSRAEALLKSI